MNCVVKKDRLLIAFAAVLVLSMGLMFGALAAEASADDGADTSTVIYVAGEDATGDGSSAEKPIDIAKVLTGNGLADGYSEIEKIVFVDNTVLKASVEVPTGVTLQIKSGLTVSEGATLAIDSKATVKLDKNVDGTTGLETSGLVVDGTVTIADNGTLNVNSKLSGSGKIAAAEGGSILFRESAQLFDDDAKDVIAPAMTIGDDAVKIYKVSADGYTTYQAAIAVAVNDKAVYAVVVEPLKMGWGETTPSVTSIDLSKVDTGSIANLTLISYNNNNLKGADGKDASEPLCKLVGTVDMTGTLQALRLGGISFDGATLNGGMEKSVNVPDADTTGTAKVTNHGWDIRVSGDPLRIKWEDDTQGAVSVEITGTVVFLSKTFSDLTVTGDGKSVIGFWNGANITGNAVIKDAAVSLHNDMTTKDKKMTVTGTLTLDNANVSPESKLVAEAKIGNTCGSLASLIGLSDGTVPIVLLKDASLSVKNDDITISKGAVIDLSAHTLKVKGDNSIVIVGCDVSISNGKIVWTGNIDGAHSNFCIEDDGALTLDGIEMSTSGTALLPEGSETGTATSVTVKDSTIEAGAYAIATNNSYTGDKKLNISILNSSLTTTGTNGNGDDTTVMINAPNAVLDVQGSKLTGNHDVLAVRSGVATVSDTEIVYTNAYMTANGTGATQPEQGLAEWMSGNNYTCAAIIAGSSYSSAAYGTSAKLTISGGSITAPSGKIVTTNQVDGAKNIIVPDVVIGAGKATKIVGTDGTIEVSDLAINAADFTLDADMNMTGTVKDGASVNGKLATESTAVIADAKAGDVYGTVDYILSALKGSDSVSITLLRDCATDGFASDATVTFIGNGHTLTINGDSSAKGIVLSDSIVIDGKGHTLTTASSSGILISEGKGRTIVIRDITVKDASTDLKDTYGIKDWKCGAAGGSDAIADGYALTLEKVTIQGYAAKGLYIGAAKQLDVIGCSFVDTAHNWYIPHEYKTEGTVPSTSEIRNGGWDVTGGDFALQVRNFAIGASITVKHTAFTGDNGKLSEMMFTQYTAQISSLVVEGCTFDAQHPTSLGDISIGKALGKNGENAGNIANQAINHVSIKAGSGGAVVVYRGDERIADPDTEVANDLMKGMEANALLGFDANPLRLTLSEGASIDATGEKAQVAADSKVDIAATGSVGAAGTLRSGETLSGTVAIQELSFKDGSSISSDVAFGDGTAKVSATAGESGMKLTVSDVITVTGSKTATVDADAVLGTDVYGSVDDLLKHSTDGNATITLLRDCSANGIAVAGAITFIAGGHTLTLNGASTVSEGAALVVSNGNLVVTGSVVADGTIAAVGGTITLAKDASLTLPGHAGKVVLTAVDESVMTITSDAVTLVSGSIASTGASFVVGKSVQSLVIGKGAAFSGSVSTANGGITAVFKDAKVSSDLAISQSGNSADGATLFIKGEDAISVDIVLNGAKMAVSLSEGITVKDSAVTVLDSDGNVKDSIALKDAVLGTDGIAVSTDGAVLSVVGSVDSGSIDLGAYTVAAGQTLSIGAKASVTVSSLAVEDGGELALAAGARIILPADGKAAVAGIAFAASKNGATITVADKDLGSIAVSGGLGITVPADKRLDIELDKKGDSVVIAKGSSFTGKVSYDGSYAEIVGVKAVSDTAITAGSVEISGDYTTEADGSITIYGAATMSGSLDGVSVTVSKDSVVTVPAGTTLTIDDATVTVQSGSKLDVDGTVVTTGDGKVSNTGSIKVVGTYKAATDNTGGTVTAAVTADVDTGSIKGGMINQDKPVLRMKDTYTITLGEYINIPVEVTSGSQVALDITDAAGISLSVSWAVYADGRITGTPGEVGTFKVVAIPYYGENVGDQVVFTVIVEPVKEKTPATDDDKKNDSMSVAWIILLVIAALLTVAFFLTRSTYVLIPAIILYLIAFWAYFA